ncbi:hypothetical protein pb186bvf_005784 [Paramecium bursaria]
MTILVQSDIDLEIEVEQPRELITINLHSQFQKNIYNKQIFGYLKKIEFYGQSLSKMNLSFFILFPFILNIDLVLCIVIPNIKYEWQNIFPHQNDLLGLNQGQIILIQQVERNFFILKALYCHLEYTVL